MMKVIKDFRFSAAHRLSKVPGGHPCARLHGHNYRIRIECDGPVKDDTDMVIDFHDVSVVVKPLVESLDHQFINDVVEYENTTAEWLCEWFFKKIPATLPISAIEVWETETCCARMEVNL